MFCYHCSTKCNPNVCCSGDQSANLSACIPAYDFLDLPRAEPVRRDYSTSNLQGMNNIQVAAENCTQGIAAAATNARPYNAEERRERVERYRSKRNQRNFHKKITYACRKTLADGRPRVRGRFARNEKTETDTEPKSAEVSFECCSRSTWDNSCDRNNPDGSDRERWGQMQAALAAPDGEKEFRYDEDIWACLDNMFSMNFLP